MLQVMSAVYAVFLKFYLNLFQDVPDYLSDLKNNLRQSQFSKKRGGGPARYDHDHRFNGFFFKPSLR